MTNIYVGVPESHLGNKISKCCLILCIMLSGVFFSCDKDDSIEKVLPYITKVDIDRLAQQQLPGYQLQGTRILPMMGREYVYTKDQESLSVTIGLHSSAGEVAPVADEYMSSLSIEMKEGINLGLPIGDKFWWQQSSESSHTTNIVFTRKNAIVILKGSQNSKINLEELARKIDNDLQMNSTYVKRAAEMEGIVSIMMVGSKSMYFEGDIAYVTISAIDQNNEPLEYHIDGWSYFNRAENTFTKTITRDYIEESFSYVREIKVSVVNKSNAIRVYKGDLPLSY